MRGPAWRGLAFASLLLATALLFAGPAQAKTIQVKPKKAGAIQKAIDKAKPGDTLVIHEGTYTGAIVVDKKKLTLKKAKGEKRPTIDADCQAQRAVEITAERTSLSGLKVTGAAEGFGSFPSSVDYQGIDRGSVDDVVLRNKCGSAEYGVNVFDGGAIEITDTNSKGFTDAGVYVGNITRGEFGPMVISGNEASGNNRGVIVEDSHDVDIRVIENDLHDNTKGGEGIPSGIFVKNSDGTLIRKNTTNGNGVYGIHLDGNSDNTLLVGNKSKSNGTANFFDEGFGNCGSGNSFQLPAC